ncbi:MAG: hypothetical protein QOF16_1543 [Actinomycetota bacterium]|nr:hypothetical protein [Actinomycetota bacterium]
MAGGPGDDTLDGGSGTDFVTYQRTRQAIAADLSRLQVTGDGSDNLVRIEGVVGSAYDDTLVGDTGPNFFRGRRGDDKIIGGRGDDSLDGGEGVDTVSYKDVERPISVDLATEMATGQGRDSLLSIEDVIGSNHRDVITGNSLDNVLYGRGGADTLSGLAGRDSLYGGPGGDRLLGGTGSDILRGGPGKDRCRPGTGSNALRSCG